MSIDRPTLRIEAVRAWLLAFVVALSMISGTIVLATPTNAAQSVENPKDIASHSDSTTQSMDFTYQLGPATIECTLKTDQMRQYGVTVKSASVSGTDKISMSVNSNGNIAMTIQKGSESGTATVTITMRTDKVQIPDQELNHETDCTTTASQSDPISAQQTGFAIQETGIQATNDTQIHEADATVENDTTLTQSVDLDLLVPDDGDSDGDTYNVTIDTSDAHAHGINVTGAAVENDPSGSDALVEVVGSPTVADDGNVTLTIREAAADQSNGNISRETITVGLDLDATQHDAGEFVVADSVTHVISDEAGNTTANVSFETTASSDADQGSPISLSVSAGTAAPGENVTLEFNFTNTNDTSMAGPALNVTGIPANWSVVDHETAGATFSTDPPSWLWLSLGAGVSKQPTLTLSVPNSTAPGNYSVTANGVGPDSTVQKPTTITITENATLSINDAIAGDDGEIGISDIQQAIQYWANNEVVPDTGGKTIGIAKIQELIQLWAGGG